MNFGEVFLRVLLALTAKMRRKLLATIDGAVSSRIKNCSSYTTTMNNLVSKKLGLASQIPQFVISIDCTSNEIA